MANTTWSTTDKVSVTLTVGNLLATQAAANSGVRSAHSVTSGKYYWEYTFPTGTGSSQTGYGIANASANLGTVSSTGGVNACIIPLSGNISVNGGSTGVTVAPNTNTNRIICLALDMTAKLVWMRTGAATAWNAGGSADPATGVGGIDITSIASTGIYALFCTSQSASEKCTANFGDTAFSGAVPVGFTSGFPAGPTNALATQLALEQWLTTDPAAQLTQMLVEEWGTVSTAPNQAVATQMLIEQWASVAVLPPGGAQARVMVLS